MHGMGQMNDETLQLLLRSLPYNSTVPSNEALTDRQPRINNSWGRQAC